MDADHSFVLKAVADEANKRIARGEEFPYGDVFYDCMDNARTVWPKHYEWAAVHTSRRYQYRRLHNEKVRRHLLKSFAAAFRTFDMALASAEFTNRFLTHAFFDRDEAARGSLLFGIEHTVGEMTAKLLTLTGFHSRLIRTATEVSTLLQTGYPEGASARCRTVYELLIKALVILRDTSESGYELAERYYVSGLKEAYGSGPYPQDVQRVADEARRRWGPEFFQGDNNWALPAVSIPRGRRVSFRDLENIVEAQDIHQHYLEGNAAIHAGALTATGEADFRRPYLFNSRTEVDVQSTSRIGNAVAFFLQIGVYEIARLVTSDAGQWDYVLSMSDFVQQIKAAQLLFAEAAGTSSEDHSSQ